MDLKLKEKTLADILKTLEIELKVFDNQLIENLNTSNPFVDRIIRYITGAGGKRIRPAMTFLVSKAINKTSLTTEVFQVGLALELIHTATLIHDDVIDDADKRRNVETVSRKWNNQTAVIAGDYLLSKALGNLVNTKNTSVIKLFADIMSEICVGEMQQNLQEKTFIQFDDYIEKSKRKTALLFVAGCKSAAMLSPVSNNKLVVAIENFAENFGIAFQIIDDILNFTSTEDDLGKPICDDLKNGIITLPVIFAMEQNGSNLTDLINNENYEKACDLIINSNGIAKSKELAQNYIKKAIKELDVVEESVYKQALIDLSYFVLNRNN